MNRYVFSVSFGKDDSLNLLRTAYIEVSHPEVKSLKAAFQVAITKAYNIKKDDEVLSMIGLLEREEG